MPANVFTNRSAVTSAHPAANKAAEIIFTAGGNAFDAAVAACLACAVVAPQSVGLGGYGGCCVGYLADKKIPVGVDFDSRAPLAYRDELFADPESRRFGYLAATVPGVVAGLDLILRSYGTISFSKALEYAAGIAAGGFVPDPITYKEMCDFTGRADEISKRAVFGDAGLPRTGKHWIPQDLANTMRLLIEQGPGILYRGEIADRIVAQVQSHGGILTTEDFERYQAELVEPLRIQYRDFEVYSSPPPAAGITALQILKILSFIDQAEFKNLNGRCLHLLAEALKLGWQDRDLLGDPDFVPVPIGELLDENKARRAAAQILAGPIINTTSRADSGIHTVNICTVDSAGNAVSLTATNGFMFGSQRAIEGLGIVLGHGMSRFDYIPGHPNYPAPLKRMQHNMCPGIAVRDGKVRFIWGLPGGTRIVSVTAAMAVELIDTGLSPAQVTCGPRIHTEGAEPLTVTESLPADICSDLIAAGHKLSKEKTVGGPSNAIRIGPDGTIDAGATIREEVWVPTERGA